MDNSSDNFFKGIDSFGDIQLKEAYKIENLNLLKDFEDRLASSPNSILKGLFSVIEWEQVYGLTTYGVSGKKPKDYYRKKIL
jgi:hypothetical protein